MSVKGLEENILQRNALIHRRVCLIVTLLYYSSILSAIPADLIPLHVSVHKTLSQLSGEFVKFCKSFCLGIPVNLTGDFSLIAFVTLFAAVSSGTK